MDHIFFIVCTLLGISVLMLIISTALLRYWERKLKANKKKLIQLYKDQIVILKLYRDRLKEIKELENLERVI